MVHHLPISIQILMGHIISLRLTSGELISMNQHHWWLTNHHYPHHVSHMMMDLFHSDPLPLTGDLFTYELHLIMIIITANQYPDGSSDTFYLSNEDNNYYFYTDPGGPSLIELGPKQYIATCQDNSYIPFWPLLPANAGFFYLCNWFLQCDCLHTTCFSHIVACQYRWFLQRHCLCI